MIEEEDRGTGHNNILGQKQTASLDLIDLDKAFDLVK